MTTSLYVDPDTLFKLINQHTTCSGI